MSIGICNFFGYQCILSNYYPHFEKEVKFPKVSAKLKFVPRIADHYTDFCTLIASLVFFF